MLNQSSIREMDAVVLCGGLGTRIQAVLPGRQKVLAEVGNRPFLGTLLDRVFAQGVRRAVLCVGHYKDQVIAYVNEEKARNSKWRDVIFSEEAHPLGTGGAIINAESKIAGEIFFVLNGDTLAEVDLAALYEFHLARSSFLTIAAAPVPGRADVGSLDIDQNSRILGFREKAETRAGIVNAGTYVFCRKTFSSMSGTFSLEQDFFPAAVASSPCFAFVTNVEVLDIGTPERYLRANQKTQHPH